MAMSQNKYVMAMSQNKYVMSISQNKCCLLSMSLY